MLIHISADAGPMRLCLLLLCTTTLLAGESSSVRELVDRIQEIEAQIALMERESALPFDRNTIWSGAARGMVQAVDPWGGYLRTDEVAIYGLGAEPQTRGLGFDWRHEDSGVVVITRIVPNSPAAQQSLQSGMEILSINDLETAKASRREVAESLARSGETVRLRLRPLSGEAINIALQRAALVDDGISAVRSPAPGIGLIRIGRFLPSPVAEGKSESTATAQGMRNAIASFTDLRAVILDLRGCSGGNLQAAVECAAAWTTTDAPIVEQVGRDPARSRMWTATVSRVPLMPVIVLVDGGTASSAEVLAHALRHHLRAPVVGSPTMGKGTVQQLFLLPRGDALRLTVARLRAPSGAWLDQPLQPDVVVHQTSATTAKAFADEDSKTDGTIDHQLIRAVELAAALIMREGR